MLGNKSTENTGEDKGRDAQDSPAVIQPKAIEEIHQEVLGILSEKVVEQLRRTRPDDVAFLHQTYGDVADLVITASVDRELVEALYGRDNATRLWDPGPKSGPENGETD